MGVSTLAIARTDSEAATLITSNIDPRDHAFVLGATEKVRPLMEVMLEAESKGVSGDRLQKVEDDWLKSAKLRLLPEVLLGAIKSANGDTKTFQSQLPKVVGKTALLSLASKCGLKSPPHFDWDSPRTREGYYRFQGGTPASIARAIAYAPHADLIWMETKSPIYAQAKEFADGVHAAVPDQWLAYNLSPSFNWEAAGLSTNDMKEYCWKLGKLGFVFQFVTLAGLHSNAYINDLFARQFAKEGMKAYVELIQKREREIGCDVLTHQKVYWLRRRS